MIRRLRQALAMLLLCSAVFLPVNYVLLPLIEIFAARLDEVKELQQTAQRFEATARQIPALQNVANSLPSRMEQSLLSVGDRNAGANVLTEIVRGLLSAAETEIRTIQPLEQTKVEDLTRFGLRVEFLASNEMLIRVLEQLERNVPLLFVENLVVSSIDNTANRKMTVRIDLSAYAAVRKP